MQPRAGFERAFDVLVMFLLLAFAVAIIPLGAAHAQTQAQLSVSSQSTAGASMTGYYVALSQGGNVVATGFTPTAFTLADGQSYTVQADGYGSCQFDHWADTGSASSSRTISISSNTQIMAVYNCGGSTGGGGGGGGGGASSVTVSSTDLSSNPISGYYVALVDSSGNVVKSGFTAATFATTAGVAYGLQADGYGSCAFSHWSNGATSDPMSFSAATGSMSFTAVYNCGGSTSGGGGGTGGGGSSGETGAGPGTITIYDHRVPQSDWAPCFATVCSAGTGPGASMWVTLYDSSGNVVGTGFADENGHTFTGLNPSATYYLYPADCDSCHTSTHDVLFNHWGDGSTTRPLAVVASGSFYDAWYICTNTCGGV